MSASQSAPLSLDVEVEPPDTQRPPPPDRATDGDLGRYVTRSVIGEGGMGEVRLGHDPRIGRDVALKVMIPSRGLRDVAARDRFTREACIQGQLEHPCIVPVYDLGRTPGGDPWFAMKRVRGVTLEEVIDGLRRGDPQMAARFPMRRLLAAFAQVCLTVDYAHAREVTHRDLKPANVMLGDYGEVYVLDWGAAVVSEGTSPGVREVVRVLQDPFEEPLVMGTPGYMAPEVLKHGAIIDHRVDVYALGALLFELLALVPLHVGTQPTELMKSTVAGADARFSVRCPDRRIPRELEALCQRATATRPEERYASARELYERIDSFLDGYQDREQRRQLASLQTEVAKRALARAEAGGPDAGDAHREAIRGIGRALAADPTDAGALRTMVRILRTPSVALPREAHEAMREEREARAAEGAGALRFGRLSWLLYLPFLLLLGVRSWPIALVTFGLAGSAMLVSGLVYSRRNVKPWAHGAVTLYTMLTIAPLALLFGPYIAVPAVVTSSLSIALVHLDRRGRMVASMAACAAVLLPAALEALGWLPPSLEFVDGTMRILPRLHEFPEVPTRVLLLVMGIAPIVTMGLLLGRVRDTMDASDRRRHLHAWQLAQLVPEGAGKVLRKLDRERS